MPSHPPPLPTRAAPPESLLARFDAPRLDSPSVFDVLATRAPQHPESPSPAPAQRTAPTSRVGTRYRMLREIARGGMGCIWLVQDRDLDRTVVMKSLVPELLRHASFQELVVREARSAGKLSHPNIVPVLDLGMTESGQLYFTMPYVQGQTLSELIRGLKSGDAGALASHGFLERLQIVVKICEAVAHAHSFAILHRDIKPSNVMIGSFGEVLVMDWGLAHSLTAEDPTPGQVVGTPGYMAPEQAAGKTAELTPAADVYGIGALMYHLLSLRPPYEDLGDNDEPKTIQTSAPPPADSLNVQGQPRIPREVGVILARAMHADPARRHSGAAELRDDILRYLDGTAPVVCVHTGMKRALRRVGGLVDQYGHAAIIVIVTLTLLPWFLVLAALVS